jgi:hypothetical protein
VPMLGFLSKEEKKKKETIKKSYICTLGNPTSRRRNTY